MQYNLNDVVIINNVEGQVSFINSLGDAYLTPINEGDLYRDQYLLIGVVFCVLSKSGKDKKTGHKAHYVNSLKCGAV